MNLTDDDKIEALAAIFRCDAVAAGPLASVFTASRLPACRTIANQGEMSSQCWLVIDGALKVEAINMDGQAQQLALYGPGEFLGAYPEPTVQRAEIATTTRTLLLRAQVAPLLAAVESERSLAAGMARLLARQLDRALDRMVLRTTCSAAGRVYAELMALADGATELDPPPRITSLALAANTTRETASRAIAVLIRRGIISKDDEKLVIHSPRMVTEMIT